MQEAFGGLLNVFLLALFLTIVSGILAISVNYIKAFRMKNYIISTVEKYEGSSCFQDQRTACSDEIVSSANKIGYGGSGLSCPNDYSSDVNGLYCYRLNRRPNTSSGKLCLSEGKCTYSIITQVDFDFPVINKILSFDFFQVHGDTRVIEVRKTKDS